jgi:hypothetical protein
VVACRGLYQVLLHRWFGEQYSTVMGHTNLHCHGSQYCHGSHKPALAVSGCMRNAACPS